MKHFIGAMFMMSCLGYSQIRLYWARQTRVPPIADILTVTDFSCGKKKNVSCKWLGNQWWGKERWPAVEIETVHSNDQDGLTPASKKPVSKLDEQIIPFTSRTTLKPCAPCKPHPTGLKNFVLSSPSEMALDFVIYHGKFALAARTLELGVGACSVLRLSKSMPTCSSLFFFYCYFTTAPLLRCLSS